MNSELKELRAQVAQLRAELKSLKSLLALPTGRALTRDDKLHLRCRSLCIEDDKGGDTLRMLCDEHGPHLILNDEKGAIRAHLGIGGQGASLSLNGIKGEPR